MNPEQTPKSDAELQGDVRAKLRYDTAIDATRIGVAAANGIVTLSGDVDNDLEKREAARSARTVAGVRDLTIELSIAPPGAIGCPAARPVTPTP